MSLSVSFQMQMIHYRAILKCVSFRGESGGMERLTVYTFYHFFLFPNFALIRVIQQCKVLRSITPTYIIGVYLHTSV